MADSLDAPHAGFAELRARTLPPKSTAQLGGDTQSDSACFPKNTDAHGRQQQWLALFEGKFPKAGVCHQLAYFARGYSVVFLNGLTDEQAPVVLQRACQSSHDVPPASGIYLMERKVDDDSIESALTNVEFQHIAEDEFDVIESLEAPPGHIHPGLGSVQTDQPSSLGKSPREMAAQGARAGAELKHSLVTSQVQTVGVALVERARNPVVHHKVTQLVKTTDFGKIPGHPARLAQESTGKRWVQNNVKSQNRQTPLKKVRT